MNCSKSKNKFTSLFALALGAALASSVAAASIEIKPDGRVLHVAVAMSADGKQNEIVVARTKRGEDGTTRRFLDRYSLAGGAAKLISESRVPEDVVAFGLGDFTGKGKQQIVLFTGESVFAMPDPSDTVNASDKPDNLIKLIGPHRFIFNRPNSYSLPLWNLISDLNNDKLDDMIVADGEGYAVYLQGADHKLALAGRPKIEYNFATRAATGGYLPTELGSDQDTQGEWGSPWRRGARRAGGLNPGATPILTTRAIDRVASADANGDAMADLLTLKGSRLLFFFQGEKGFSSEHDRARDFSAEITKRAWDDEEGEGFSLTCADVTGDGRADVVLAEIDPQDLNTKMRLYLGGENGIADQPAQVLKLTGLGDSPQLEDVNGDGRRDLCFLVIRADKILALKKASVEEIEAAYYVYLFDKAKNQFTTKPDIRREFTVSIAGEIEAEPSQDFFHLADFNGDGVKDLVCFENKGAINIYAITASGEDKMNVKLDSNPLANVLTTTPRAMASYDLDGDGKDELIVVDSSKIQIVKN